MSATYGVITANVLGGTQSISGLGFAPDALIFFGGRETATGENDNQAVSTFVGMSDGTTDASQAHGASGGTWHHEQNAEAIHIVNESGVSLAEGNISALGADGFTITWATTPAAAYLISYIAIGGEDLTNTATGRGNVSGSADTAFTGLGFQPDVVFLLSANNNTYPGSISSSNTVSWSFGVDDGGAAAGSVAAVGGSRNNSTTDGASRAHSATWSIHRRQEAASVRVKTMDSDGFTLEISGGSFSGEMDVQYLAIKGGNFAIGSSTFTATGNTAVTGFGFTPQVMLVMAATDANAEQSSSGLRYSIGAATGSSNEGMHFHGADDNTPHATGSAYNDDEIQRGVGTSEGLPATPDYIMDFVSLDADGFTYNISDAPVTTQVVLFLGMDFGGSAPGFGPGIIFADGISV